MSSIKMVALLKHPFGTGERDAGEEYEATAGEAATLIALGWAKEAPAKKAAALTPARQPDAAVEKALEPAADTKALDTDAADKKRAYQRRDLKAKD